jgi:GTP-binding protein HflX
VGYGSCGFGGYTNVGKSTLMNAIGKSDVFVENKLFATLDTTVRKVVIKTCLLAF